MNQDELSIESPTLGKLKASGQTLLILLCLAAAAASVFGVYLMFEHRAEAKTRDLAIATAIEKMAVAQEEAARAQRETACIVAYRGTNNANPRETIEFCKQITR